MASQYEPTTSELFATAQQAIGLASLSAGRIGGLSAPGLKEVGFNFSPNDINLDAPPKFSDLFDGADNAEDIIARLNDQVDEWLAKYFPSINGAFKNIPDDWLIGVISGTKPFGIDSTIFDLVWHKARDRAGRTVRSEQRTLEANFSERGFTMPPGALVDAIMQAEQRGVDSVLDVNRDQAIKDAEIKNDLLKMAVQVAAQLKQGILDTSAQFFKAYYDVYGLDNDIARIRASAYNAYYAALANYYQIEVSLEQIRLRAAEGDAEAGASIDRNRVALFGANGAASAHAQAARGFADIASSSSAAAGTLVAQVESV